MVAAFPAAKLGTLVIKQLSKPIALFIKERAKASPVFRKYVCMPPAQFYNWCEVQAKMWALNLGRPVNIPVLNEAMAIELGANLLGEGILFIIAAALLINEYNRSTRKEEKKEKELQMGRDAMLNSIQELYFLTQKQSAQIHELHRQIYDLDSRVVTKPWKPKKPDDDHDHPVPSGLPENQVPSYDYAKPLDESTKQVPNSDDNNETTLLPKHNKPTSEEAPTNPQSHVQKGIVLKAVMNIENELLFSNSQERGNSVLYAALKHLYEEVYRGR